MGELLPPSWENWADKVIPVLQIIIIIVAAWLLKRFVKKILEELKTRYNIPPEIQIGAYRTLSFIIFSTAVLLILDRLGVSGTVLWAAFTGFAAVAAVAFFAAWSVLSNIFCTLLIILVRPFRLYDYIELLENGEKPGLKGQVIDINVVYTTMRERNEDGTDTVLQIPNNLFFQRTLRRWLGNSTPHQSVTKRTTAQTSQATPEKVQNPSQT